MEKELLGMTRECFSIRKRAIDLRTECEWCIPADT